jgi:ribosomal protein L16 Arg81 hydroxylase
MINTEPGDMLYIPVFYWHQVCSLTDSISMNIFFGDNGENNFVEKIITTHKEKFSFWLLNIIEQNRELESFGTLYHQLEKALYYFFIKQWHDEASDEQLKVVMEIVNDYLKSKNFEIKELKENFQLSKIPKFKIRGLLHRD